MPRFIQRLYPERIWAFSHIKDSVFLTFDDGPISEVTPWVLDELKKHNAKTTFFCIGENVKKHPEIFERILSEGHSVGNHTFNHLKGINTETSKYIENTLLAEKLIDSKLFRPPYGKITSKQAKTLQNKGFKIVMWDVLSYDYDGSVSEEKCLKNVINNIKPGSVVVFHDSLKAEKNLRYVLPKVLEFIGEKGLLCNSIKQNF
ncbi:polysaccharide deacetylase [Aequorivita soesokkakensis]|jgi:peptidoglycan/xylan/chitin deacetylase (PgdA/CDA1 family)|uniref:Polysaccharide deacetylase n=1 Tax=Aequorivita soesokkakensis TaxID=1385699 RepID=A0A1A9LEU9_9FLAO|nr:polysaccharide deacetylase family protein [Aequorivita soesokkakensis]OAD91798.1 polysaccharide deacetylase [Aequorivita soesokkakensis]